VSLSRQGKLHDVGVVFNLVEEAGLKLDLGSYCAALECMGRQGSDSHLVSR